MSISQMLLPEFDQEMANTRKTLERIPEHNLTYKPHAKSMPLDRLAGHIAEMPIWGTTTLTTDSMDMDPATYQPLVATSAAQVLAAFDAVFDVIEDRDADPTRRALAWAEETGRLADVAPELLARASISDEEIEKLVAERTQAKKQRNFARADQIRNELLEKGVVIEDSKDGVRWKRK